MKSRLPLPGLLLLAVCSTAACSTGGSPAQRRITDPAVRLMELLDADGSGDLTPSELPLTDPRMAFRIADTDQDERVSLQELRAGMAEYREFHAVRRQADPSAPRTGQPQGATPPAPEDR